MTILDTYHIKYDRSGVGHNWIDATEDNCPPDIQEEIAAFLEDEGFGKIYRGSNGQQYMVLKF